jgi:ribosomal protein S27AE
MDRIIGTCGRCGGDVMVATHWWGSRPPRPTCIKCGATQKQNLPVLEMEEAPSEPKFLRD